MSNPEIEIITPGSSKSEALLGMLAQVLASGGAGGFEPVSHEELEKLYLSHQAISQWDVVQLREEFDCTTPTLKMGQDYVVVRLLERPVFNVDTKTHTLTVVDCAVACRIKGHGTPGHGEDHYHYHEIGVNSRALMRIGSLKDTP